MPKIRALIAAATLAANTACYSYTVVPTAEVPAGASVRTELSPDAAARLAERRGRADAAISGRFVASTPDTLVLDVLYPRDHPASLAQPLYDRLELATSDVRRLEMQRLSRGRTLAVAGLGAAAAAVLVASLFGGHDKAGGTNGSHTGNKLVVPFFH
ncbi:MAG TPA: hypothetical protein VFQ38_17350 [Longimicrobiales bacterium]|nr:hypothetical protein [Longimicrobiales bacterium]